MSVLRISEAASVQFPMVRHVEDIGWVPLSPELARQKRGGESTSLFKDDLAAKLKEFNAWLTRDAVRSIIETIEAIPATIEGNRDVLSWLRGERSWYDEDERRHRRVRVIDFARASANVFHVSWEWVLKPPSRKGTRADLVFVINGIPVCIVEHKNPKDGNAIERGITQLRRYEKETPDLLGTPQLFNVTHLLDYWYGVTWNVTRREMARWKDAPDETYRYAVQAFFEPTEFLRTLNSWVLFYVLDGELKKSVLRQHQSRAIKAIVERCAEATRKRGLIWHTQGSGKTFTLLTAARLLLTDRERFGNATVIAVVDRAELEGQLKGWIERLLGEMHKLDIATAQVESKSRLQELLDSDFRGLVVSMIHKFDDIRKASVTRDNVFVFIDEAHRSVAHELGTFLMAAVPSATIIGFTGTPIAKTADGEGTFKIFGADDASGYLDKYSIRESIEDETTLPIKHLFAPSEIRVPAERLDAEFFSLAGLEGVTDVEELNRVLDRAVGLKTFLKSDERVANVAAFVAKHFKENVLPLGYKALLVAVDRDACAKYKAALDKLLPPEWIEPVYSRGPADIVDRPLVARYQLDEQRESAVKTGFKKPDEQPKIIIVTDKLLTGYDAPVLYCMYLDKPMRDHVLLQAIARVNRPFEDAHGVRKSIGLVVDFVGMLRELNKALRFDSADVSGVIEDLDVLLADFKRKIAAARTIYLDAGEGGGADEQLERIVYGRFLELESRKIFFEVFKDIENLWEILSPSSELRDDIATFKGLAQLYAAVRNAYAEKVGFVADLAYKTRRLVEEGASHEGLGRFTKAITFDTQTLDALRREGGPDEGKVINLVRGLQKELDENPASSAVLQSLKDRAERVLKDLEQRKTSGLAAMDYLAQLAAEKDAAAAEAAKSGLSPGAFGVYWMLREEEAIKVAGVDAMSVAREAQALLERFPNARANPDEQRQLRAQLYRPLLSLASSNRTRIVEAIVAELLR